MWAVDHVDNSFYDNQIKFSKKNFGTALVDFSEDFSFPMEETWNSAIRTLGNYYNDFGVLAIL